MIVPLKKYCNMETFSNSFYVLKKENCGRYPRFLVPIKREKFRVHHNSDTIWNTFHLSVSNPKWQLSTVHRSPIGSFLFPVRRFSSLQFSNSSPARSAPQCWLWSSLSTHVRRRCQPKTTRLSGEATPYASPGRPTACPRVFTRLLACADRAATANNQLAPVESRTGRKCFATREL